MTCRLFRIAGTYQFGNEEQGAPMVEKEQPPIGPQDAAELKAWREAEGLTQVEAGARVGLSIWQNPKTGHSICRHWQKMEEGKVDVPRDVAVICEYITCYGWPPKRKNARRKGRRST